MHLRSAPGVGGLKGHIQLWDRADLDTTFESLKAFTSTRNQIYASDTSRNPLQSYLVFHSILYLLMKIPFEQTFTHPITLYYHIWFKTVFKET